MNTESASGSPLAAAIIGAENLEESLKFYRDVIGLDTSPVETWAGPAFERLWNLPKGASARAALCQAGSDEVGRVLLAEFDSPDRQRVRENGERRAYSLFNLNFYTHDIFAAHTDLSARGYEFWSEPVNYALSDAVGAPIEVIFEGPDGVAINLVELKGGDPDTQIGRMRAYLESHGTTSTGYTNVVTSAHCVRSRDRAVDFYTQVLGMGIIIDEELSKPETNHFLGLAEGSRTHITFFQGNNKFGKVAMSYPVNYDPPDLIPRSQAPNIGYIAQAFVVADLGAAEAACERAQAETYAPRMEIDLPGIGERAVTTVRNPASGAITLLIEAV